VSIFAGIDPAPFERALDSPAVKDKIIDLQRRFDGKRVLLGIDRLDYVKASHTDRYKQALVSL